MEPLQNATHEDSVAIRPAMRRVAVVVRRDTDGVRLRELMRQLVSSSCVEVRVMASRPGRVRLADATRISVVHDVSRSSGDRFDCIYVVEGGESTQRLADRLAEGIFLRTAMRSGVPVFSLQRNVVPTETDAGGQTDHTALGRDKESSRFQMA